MAVGSWIAWSILSWDKNYRFYKPSKLFFFQSKWWSGLKTNKFWVKIVVNLWICSAFNMSYFCISLGYLIICDSWANSQKLTQTYNTLDLETIFCFKDLFCNWIAHYCQFYYNSTCELNKMWTDEESFYYCSDSLRMSCLIYRILT